MRNILHLITSISMITPAGTFTRHRPFPLVPAIVAALVIALILPAMAAGAQGAQLEVREVKPLQVIEDVPLVAGKPVAVKVVINSGGAMKATLEVTLGAPRKTLSVSLKSGLNTFYVPIDSPTAAGSIEVQATVTSGTSSGRLSQMVEVIAPDLNHLNIVLLPVDWTSQDRAGGKFPSTYNTFATTSGDFMKATYPIQDSNVQITASATNFMLTAQQRLIADGQGNFNWENLTAMYTAIGLAGRRIMGNSDLVVGVLPPKWFARNLNEPSTVGLEFHAVKHVVAAQVNSDYATIAHEVGHIFRQEDDYNFNTNPPKIGNRITVPGYRVGTGRAIIPGSKPIYYSFMGASDAGSEYWVDTDTYIEILNLMQSGSIP